MRKAIPIIEHSRKIEVMNLLAEKWPQCFNLYEGRRVRQASWRGKYAVAPRGRRVKVPPRPRRPLRPPAWRHWLT
jgi:hypothetical protein